MSFKVDFFESLSAYSTDHSVQQRIWNEIEQQHSKTHRHYHTLTHLDSLTTALKPFQEKFSNWDTVMFSIAFHDFVYNPLKKNNEEKSAEACEKYLTRIRVPDSTITSCRKLILATKTHTAGDVETNLFTDADLSILGASADVYHQYARQIRKEYSVYPDFLYNPGRKKVLKHFLDMPAIFKTNEFFELYEAQARTNLQSELNILDKVNG